MEHPDTGKQFDHEGVPAIIDPAGIIRKLGAIPPPTLTTSFTPFAETGIKTMSDTELKAYIAGSKPKSGRHVFGPDWIRNQKSHGACAGFSMGSAADRAFYIDGQGRLQFSGAWMYSLANRNSDNGSIPEEVVGFAQTVGMLPVHSPNDWDKIYQSQYTAADRAEAANYKLGPDNVFVTNNRQEFLTGVALGFKGAVAVHVGNNFMRLGSNGEAGADRGPGNHAVCIDDIDLIGGKLLLDLPNSWDVTFGDQGRCYLNWEDHLVTTSQNFNFFLIRGAINIPGQDLPSLN